MWPILLRVMAYGSVTAFFLVHNFYFFQSTTIEFVTSFWILASIRHCTLSSNQHASANWLARM
jgi:hypothetical protein